MSDVELDRIATILEKMAYEQDVRKVIRKIVKNNQLDDKYEQVYLSKSHKRGYSQNYRVEEDNNEQRKQNAIQIANQGDVQVMQPAVGSRQQHKRDKSQGAFQ